MNKLSARTISWCIIWLIAFCVSLFIHSSIINATMVLLGSMFGKSVVVVLSERVDEWQKTSDSKNESE